MLFMGEEWAASTPWQFFTDFAEDWLADAVRTGRRAEFGSHGWAAEDVPDPQDPATRDRSVLDWSEVGDPDHARMLRWYTDLTALRRQLLGVGPTRFADVDVTFDDDARWLVLRHTPSAGAPFAVVVTLGDRGGRAPVAGAGELLLAWDHEATSVGEGVVTHRCGSVSVVAVDGG